MERNPYRVPTYLLSYRVALDNHEPVRRTAMSNAMAVYLDNDAHAPTGEFAITIELADVEFFGGLERAHHCVFAVDDGTQVRLFYVAAYHDGSPAPLYPEGRPQGLVLKEFPTNPANPAMFGGLNGWMIGPSRCYHLKTDGRLRAS